MEDYRTGGEKGNSNLFATNRLFKKSPLFRKRKKKAPGIYDPKAKYRFDKGGEKNKCKDGEYWDGEKCTRLITYGKDQKLIDGVANWAMHSADPDKISLEYNDQIKHYLYTGKYGYDPINMSLIPLKTIDKKLISEPDEETKAIREKEKITEKKYFKEIEKNEAYNKALVDEPKYADEGLDFVKGWHDSPMYNQMVLNSFDGNQLGADYLTKLRKENIADIVPINIMTTSGTTPYGFNPAASSSSRTGEVKVYPEGFGIGPTMYAHEYFHSSDKPKGIYNWDFINSKDPRFPNDKERSNERVMPESDQMYITRNRASNWKDNQDYKSRVEKWPETYNMPTDEEIKKILYSQDVTEDDKDFQKSFSNLKNIIQTNYKISNDSNQKEWKTESHDYISQPSEVRARLGEIRYHARKDGIYDPFTEQITPEIFQNYINKERSNKNWQPMKPIKDLREQFTDEEILWMLQNISKNNEEEEEIKVAAKGGALLTKKVTCKKCGWEWDAADGGNDITTCHKCGGKGLIHAQKGGGLNKFKEKEMILDLSPEEIEEYRKGGYVIEDISVPSLNHMANGGQPCQEGYAWDEELQTCIKAFKEVTVNPEDESWWNRMTRKAGKAILDTKVNKNNKNKEKTFDEFRRDTDLNNMYDVVDWATKPEEVKPKKLKKPTKEEVAAQKLFDEKFRKLSPMETLGNTFTTESGRTLPIYNESGQYASPEARLYMEKKQGQEYIDKQVKNNYNDGALEGFHPEVLALAPGGNALKAGVEVMSGLSHIAAPYLGATIAGVPGLTLGNALTASSLASGTVGAGMKFADNDISGGLYSLGKGALTALPFTKFGNAELYPVLNNVRSALSFGLSGADLSHDPGTVGAVNTIKKVPHGYKPPLLPSSAPTVFSKVAGKLKKEGGAIEKNMSKLEIKKLIAQGYVIEEI